MEIPEPKEKEKKVEEIREVAKKETNIVPKKEKRVGRINRFNFWVAPL